MPLLVLMILLLLPRPWIIDIPEFNKTLAVDLIDTSEQITQMPEFAEPETPPVVVEKVQPEKAIEPQYSPEIETKQPPAKADPQTQQSTIETEVGNEPLDAEPVPNPLTSGDIMRMVNNRTSMEITPEFEARTGPAKDYFPQEPQVTDWYADIPYLDESVDKPQLQMNFYAEGLEGSIERFFDKITISKTFTTKYGTKIHCALVGVLVSCIWK